MTPGAENPGSRLVDVTDSILNRFADNISRAEALCAEVASILKGLQDVALSWVVVDAAHAPEAEFPERAEATRC